MHIQINTDRHIAGRESLARSVEDTVRDTLARFGERITRVEVHLSDVNSHKAGGRDIRCVMEARPAGLQPLATHHQAGLVDDAVQGAAEKLERALDSVFGRQEHGPRGAAGSEDVGE